MRHYTKEHKEYVVKLHFEKNRSVKSLADELGISSSTLSKWLAAAKEQNRALQGNDLTPSEVQQLKRNHRKQILDLQEEIAILKKARIAFSRNSQ